MIHIKRNRCGYTGYRCTGVPELNTMFKSLGMTCDYDMERDDDWDTDVNLPILYPKMNTYAGIMASSDAALGSPIPAPWTWYDNQLNTLFPPSSSTTEVLYAEALCSWYTAYYHFGTGDVDAPYQVTGVDAVTTAQLLETLTHYIAAWKAWNLAQGSAATEPKFKTYMDQYMSASNYIDNYLNLPVHFTGFVTTWQPIADMGAGYSLVAPEEECRDNFNPLTPGGFIDLFGETYMTAVTARSSDSEDPSYSSLYDSLICFGDGYFEPGVVEPPLPFEPASPAWPVLTQTESSLDGASLGLVNLTQWRTIVNTWLNDSARSLMHIWGLRSLFTQMMQTNITEGLTIEMANNGDVLTWDNGASVTPQYHVAAASGAVSVNGNTVSVSSSSAVSLGSANQIYFWLNITLGSCNSSTGRYGSVSASISTSQSGDISIGIGGVRKIAVSSPGVGIPAYTLYQILQERHTVAIDIVRTCKAGVLYRFTSGASPYKVLDTAECPTQD